MKLLNFDCLWTLLDGISLRGNEVGRRVKKGSKLRVGGKKAQTHRAVSTGLIMFLRP